MLSQISLDSQKWYVYFKCPSLRSTQRASPSENADLTLLLKVKSL